MLNIFDIAGSAMSAQSIRLNTTASNMANAESISSSEDKTYKARMPVFAAVLQEQNDFSSQDSHNYGVNVEGIFESSSPSIARYQPDHPKANEEGYIYMPNINMMEEMSNMISASRSYQTNVEMLNTAKQLMQRTLALGQ
jgi:flagellar basal-body rod protein FlgC